LQALGYTSSGTCPAWIACTASPIVPKSLRGATDGAFHLPVAELVNMIVDAGFTVERMAEGGEPTPIVLSARMTKRRA
jgi:hypothetical protein